MTDAERAVLTVLTDHEFDVANDDHTLAAALIDMAPDTGDIVTTMRFYGLYSSPERMLRAARAITETINT